MPEESQGQSCWGVMVHRVAKSQTWLKQLSTYTQCSNSRIGGRENGQATGISSTKAQLPESALACLGKNRLQGGSEAWAHGGSSFHSPFWTFAYNYFVGLHHKFVQMEYSCFFFWLMCYYRECSSGALPPSCPWHWVLPSSALLSRLVPKGFPSIEENAVLLGTATPSKKQFSINSKFLLSSFGCGYF